MRVLVKVISFVVLIMVILSCFAGINAFAYDDISSIEDINISDFNFPVISVTTENGAPIVDKTNYVNCTVSISNTSEEYILEETIAGIRFRGNSTLNYADKKAYRIKFDKKQDLFGMGKAKSWVLLANAFDKTMVRNAIAFAVAQELGLEYTSLYQFVNVYLNGECLGLYLLCEQTQTGETRVNIEEDESGKVDTGYLIEFVGNGDTSEDAYFGVEDVDPSLFPEGVTVNWRSNVMDFIIKTPEKEFCTDEQISFISEYCNRFNKAILTHDWQTFNELCDVDSFAKFFIVNTILNNGDGGYQIYFYKKENGGKVYAGPVWDFDQSSGASSHCTAGYSRWYYGTSNPWFDSFVVWDEFMDLARNYYDEHIEGIKDIIDYYTNIFYLENQYDFHVNDVIWQNVSEDYWRITDEVSKLKTYEDNFSHLNKWFANRIAWLDGAYHNLGEYVYNNDETCSSDGTESAVCIDCDYVSTKTVENTKDISKHKLSEFVYNNDATCTQDGTKTAHCTNSGCLYELTVTDTDTALGHDWDEGTVTTPATCQTEGVKTYTCKNDPAHTRTEVIPVDPNAHVWGEYVYNNDATTEADGTETATCELCGAEDTRTAEGTKITIVDSTTLFTDMESGRWYKEYVDYVATFKLMNGMTPTTFEPTTTLNRAMFAQILANMSGVDTSDNSVGTVFTDVPAGKWYTPAVKWAYDNGIVDGMTPTTFEPLEPIQRQQICVMVVRYAEKFGIELTADIEKKAFEDDSNIQNYAKDAVYICQQAGIVDGKTETEFLPRDNATRAEIATIIMRFHKNFIAK